MPSEDIYAVVDIETTGTDPKKDRIIQFGCVLIKDGRIINRFATDVNPGKKISKQIQNLTKITNARVQKAPYFEDIAFTIANLLADTVFVAHNIYFDYQFLNHEFARCGVPEMTIPGIDTVELAQIFLPTATSFRLKDLADSLGLSHDNPHQADSDAEVTGALLLYIQQVMRGLPLVTMEKIAQLSGQTGMQTGQFIQKNVAEMRRQTRSLPEDLVVVSGIALKNKQVPLFEEQLYESKYPTKKKGKEQLFDGQLIFHKEQARLMNLVYRHFSGEEALSDETPDPKNLFIEAATGMGKTIGYLFPTGFLATPENPLIVSTASLLLQDQLVQKDLPLVNKVLPQPFVATVIKGQRHYLDLARFAITLQQPSAQKQYLLYQMAVLVWLTKTETGDLDELNLIRLDHPFFRETGHRGTAFLDHESPFYAHDFLRFLHKRMTQSNLLIVNHAFLARESLREEFQLPKSRFLLIDEAHHLPDNCEKAERQQVATFAFRRQVSGLNGENGLFSQLENLFAQQPEILATVRLYQQELEAIVEMQEVVITHLYQLKAEETRSELVVSFDDLQQLPLAAKKSQKKLLLYYQEAEQVAEKLRRQINAVNSALVVSEKKMVRELFELLQEVTHQGQIMTRWFEEWSGELVHWLKLNSNQITGDFQLTDFSAPLLPRTKWYERYERILYIGGTLKIGGNRHYFPERLGIAEAPVKIIQAPFDYPKQTRVILPDKGISVKQLTSQEYGDYLAKAVEEILRSVQKPVLVLFTSHDSLQRVYERLHMKFLAEGREILAQGVGGSREKLLRRFSLSKDSVLLGADSFWEGVDLPGERLEVLIVTRLPFANPKRPLTAARNRYLQSRGIDPFFEEAIPQAALRLRQAYGRLVRGNDDRGVMVILDRRLVTTKYGRKLAKAFPQKVPLQELSTEETKLELEEFLKNSRTAAKDD